MEHIAPESLSLARFLREHRDQVVETWLREVRHLSHAQGLSKPALYDHIPRLLAALTESLDAAAAGASPRISTDAPNEHALDRLDLGFDLREVIAEYAVLRRVIEQLWEKAKPPEQEEGEYRLLDRTIDEAIAISVDRFTATRERTLTAVDRISAAAFESGNLDAFLPRLLDALMQTTESVDSVVLLLLADGKLVVRASAGLPERQLEGVSIRVGDGFEGSVVADAGVKELRDASAESSVRLDAIRRQATRALFALPLTSSGAVLGVAMMGSKTAFEFSREDRILFRAMANRATSLIIQHQLLEKQQETHAQLDTLLSVSPIGVAFIDRDQRYVRINEALARANGVPVEAHLGRTVREVLGERGERVSQLLQTVLETGRPLLDLQFRVAPPATPNEMREWRSNFFPVHDVRGEITGIGVTVVEETDRVRATEQAQLRAAELDAVLHAIPEAVCDSAGVKLANRAALAMLGLDGGFEQRPIPLKELTDRLQVRDLATGERSPAEDQAFARALRGEVSDREVLLVHQKTGKEVAIRMHGAPVRIGGALIGGVVVLSDITGRKHAEAEQRRAEDFREHFLGVLGHDLRNPLSAIRATAQLLQRRAPDPAQDRALRRLLGAADRMARMISDILDFARGRLGGGFPIKRGPVDLYEVVRMVTDELKVAHVGGDVQLALTGDGRGDWDGDRIAQVISNLCGNALEHGAPGTPVIIRGRGEADGVRLEIENAGEPIPAAQLPGLFEPMRQAVGSRGSGLGLGLWIARQIVVAHGGTLDASSDPARTVFAVRLPRS